MGIAAPGSIAIRKATLKTNNGQMDLRQVCREVRIYESMMRPFIVMDMQCVDPTNFGSQLRITGGEELEFVASNVYGQIYEAKLLATKQTNEVMSSGLRAQGSTISFAGPTYFANKSAKVQESFRNVPGSSAINSIQSKYLGGSFHKLITSKGFLAEQQPYIVNNKSPFDAIKDIRYAITPMMGSTTGAYAYYADKIGHCLVPLQHAFQQGPRDQFIQDGTVGRSFLDVLRLESQIIAFQGGTSFGGGSMDPGDLVRNQSASTHRFDFQQKKFIKGMNKKVDAGLPGFPLAGKIASAASTAMHYIAHDPNLNAISPEFEKAAGEKLLGHLAQSGGTFTMMVLFDRGINLTAGENVFAKLASPLGDLTGFQVGNNRLGGKALMVNVCHHLKNYDSQPQGTTILECSQGGVNGG
jgi:hypothetical protein